MTTPVVVTGPLRMPKRSEVVGLMLTTARQIECATQFADDAEFYADMAQASAEYEAACALRAMVRTCEAEATVMREFMASLAASLAKLPV